MNINKVAAIKTLEKVKGLHQDAGGFKEILDKKRAHAESTMIEMPKESIAQSLKNAVTGMANNHETAIKSISTFMTRTDYSPERLLAVQYKTGILFLREQMFSKTAELSANTLKNFTQMQV